MYNILGAIEKKGLEHVNRIVSSRYTYVRLEDISSVEDNDTLQNVKMIGDVLLMKVPEREAKYDSGIKRTMSSEVNNDSSDCYRLILLRFGRSMGVIIVKSCHKYVTLRVVDSLQIGEPCIILDPSCTNYWRGLPVICTPHPLLPIADNTHTVIKAPIPVGRLVGGTMKPICIEVQSIVVLSVVFVKTCLHPVCDGRYGENCPKNGSGALELAPAITFVVSDAVISEMTYTSRKLGLKFFPRDMLICNPPLINNNYLNMSAFITEALLHHRGYRLIGFVKVRNDGLGYTVYVSSICVLGDDVARYTAF